jgi:hypothetical protein
MGARYGTCGEREAKLKKKIARKGFKKLDGMGGSSKRDKRRDGALARLRFRVEMVRKLEKKWAEKGQVMAVRREDFLKAIRQE